MLLPSGCVCSLVICFAFLQVFSPGLCSVFPVLPVLWCRLYYCSSFLLCFGTMLVIFFFYPFNCFWGVCPSSSGLPLGLGPSVRVPLLVLTCLSFYPMLVCSPPAFLGFSGFRFFCGVCFSCGSGCGSTFSLPFGLRFSACCGSGCSLRSFSAFCFHMLWLRLIVSVLPLHFFHLLQFWLSLPVSLPLFSLL